jgi:hypothetical protein
MSRLVLDPPSFPPSSTSFSHPSRNEEYKDNDLKYRGSSQRISHDLPDNPSRISHGSAHATANPNPNPKSSASSTDSVGVFSPEGAEHPVRAYAPAFKENKIEINLGTREGSHRAYPPTLSDQQKDQIVRQIRSASAGRTGRVERKSEGHTSDRSGLMGEERERQELNDRANALIAAAEVGLESPNPPGPTSVITHDRPHYRDDHSYDHFNGLGGTNQSIPQRRDCLRQVNTKPNPTLTLTLNLTQTLALPLTLEATQPKSYH